MWLMTNMSHAVPLLLAALLATAVGGCETVGTPLPSPWTENPPPTLTMQEPTDVKYFRSDEPLRLAVEHFDRGNYGLAEQYFRDAVEKAPNDASAWIGLAASCDRIGRFDLADRAYKQVVRLAGETPQVLNNIGYSYMLRGNFVAAKQKFVQAYQLDPGNPTIINNLQLVDSSAKTIVRAP